MLLNEAALLLKTTSKYLKYFKEIDPYNNNILEGYICTQSNNLYGALVIYKVNNKETQPQIIYATPKLSYPFVINKNTKIYKYPPFTKIKVFEKLDGTNICCYAYDDSYGKTYVTFKTRLSPILKSNKFGNFKQLWDMILEKYPHLREPEVVKNKQYNLSYELYGNLNHHLVEYDVELDTKLLFAIHYRTGKIIPNNEFKNLQPLEQIIEIDNKKDFVKFYEECRRKAEKKNIKIDETHIKGIEGYVFYVHTVDNEWILYKVKPKSIEEIHFFKSCLDYKTIMATALNLLENTDVITIESIIELLLEEFTENQIAMSKENIKKVCDDINELLAFRIKVLNIYTKEIANLHINDKSTIMRIMSQYFDKKDMRKVYSELKRLLLVN